MSLLLVGLNHQTAPLAIRERVAFSPEQISCALPALCASAQLPEAFILSTCNRTEIYTVASQSAAVLAWLVNERQLAQESLNAHVYFHRELAVVKHLAQVACGLNSMVLGEPQIFGQVKAAYQLAKTAGTLGRQLQSLCQHSFHVTKKVRTETLIGQKPVSIAFTAVSLVRRIFSAPATCNVVLLGAGETIELVAQHLAEMGISRFHFVNRTLTRAQTLATRWQGDALALSELSSVLASADIVIAATDSAELLVTQAALAKARHGRRRKPLLLIDLAVPRNIDPLIEHLPDCYLYCLDDLQALIQETIESRRDAASLAEAIIDVETTHFAKKLQHSNLAPKIQALYQQAGISRDEQLAAALQRLKNGATVEAVLHQLAHRLTQQLLHIPVTLLREKE